MIARDELLALAREAAQRAFCPYSHFHVGAAVVAGEKTYIGVNIEISSYGLTLCAERVAVFKAISEGAREFRRMAIVADSEKLTPPCGACRQILWEFCGDIEIILTNLQRSTETLQLADLFPRAFDASFDEMWRVHG